MLTHLFTHMRSVRKMHICDSFTYAIHKFYYILVSLSPNIVEKIQPDILQSRDYEKLNEAVISSHEISKPEKIDKLI